MRLQCHRRHKAGEQAVFGQNTDGRRDDERLNRARGVFADQPGRVGPVQFGHLQVHQHHVVGERLDGLDCFEAVTDDVDAVGRLTSGKVPASANRSAGPVR